MKKILPIGLIIIAFFQACGQDTTMQKKINQDSIISEVVESKNIDPIINPQGTSIQTRILTPNGFKRIEIEKNSFAEYLRQLPLKPNKSKVLLYNGRTKENDNAYIAVVALGIGNKDLHQCADAVMRLRAEYFWNQKQYDKIHFNYTNGFRVDYSQWMQGNRLVLQGNKNIWVKKCSPSTSYKDFWEYLENIFSYAGTLSLSKELKPVKVSDMKIGDVFIRGGSPGHAVIVVDMAIDTITKKKIFMLAQSYMPAQEIQILQNSNDYSISPWYSQDFENKLITPEWTFFEYDLKRFEE